MRLTISASYYNLHPVSHRLPVIPRSNGQIIAFDKGGSSR